MADQARKTIRFISSRALVAVIGLILLFISYTLGIWNNPPGFYVDESALSYNAYLVSQTGAGEPGVRFPLFFPVFTEIYTQYANPTQIYLLAAVFKIFGPSILTARLFAVACVFTACLLLGLLARRISGSPAIGLIVGAGAMATPWLFEVGRLVLETFFYPMAVVLLLWSIYRASMKERWGIIDTGTIALSLTLLTYSYTIGRLLGPLLAAGLALFITSRKRILSVLQVWTVYGLSIIPLAIYVYENPAITKRFQVLSYLNPESTFVEIATRFLYRFAEDINPLAMLIGGDVNPRHHLWGAHGSFYFGLFTLAVIGVIVVLTRHRRSSWWLYVLFGALASIVPGALTNDSFHTLRMIAYPIFLLMLTVPALFWLTTIPNEAAAEPAADKARDKVKATLIPTKIRHGILTALITLTVLQAGHFLFLYHRDGPNRGEYFDAAYKGLYEEAVARPERPVYLVDGYWGPAYIHAFWYATLEGRDRSEFVHLPYRGRPPTGSLVLSSEKQCPEDCDILSENGGYLLYIER